MRQAFPRDEIPQGTLDLLILTILDREPSLHGFQIAESIESISANILKVEEGSLYPALQRMLLKGWIAGEWGRTPENRRMIVREGLLVCAAGAAVGLPIVFAVTGGLGSLLYGLAPHDPLAIGLGIAGIVVVSLAASLAPAMRAASMDPLVALRHE